MTLIEMLKNPIDYIPSGYYCYHLDDNGNRVNCPFWASRPDLPHQENGFCFYLNESDWDMNMKYAMESEDRNGEEILIPDDKLDYNKDFDAETGLYITGCLALLWDMCKECQINETYELED